MHRLMVWLRRALFVVGVGLLVALLLSYVIRVAVNTPYPYGGAALTLNRGWFACLVLWEPYTYPGAPVATWSVTIERSHLGLWGYGWPQRPWPHLQQYSLSGDGVTGAFIPLWLLAAICLAWPVTSFFLACRRQGRGFNVEPIKDDG